MRPDQQFTCISLVATRLLALEQNGHGAPLLVRSCFRGLAIIRFSNSEEIAASLPNISTARFLASPNEPPLACGQLLYALRG
jgi:hypothetical protein